MFDSIRATPPDPTGEAVAVRGDNVPWGCGEHLALGHWHNDMSQTMYTHHVPPLPPGTQSPPPQLDSAVLVSYVDQLPPKPQHAGSTILSLIGTCRGVWWTCPMR